MSYNMETRSADWKALATAAGLLTLTALSGCRVGPKYVAPHAAAPPAYKEASPAAYDAGSDGSGAMSDRATLNEVDPKSVWHPAAPGDALLKGKWWLIFNDAELNALEDQLNINNNNIAQYFQNFLAARAQVGQQRAAYFPTVTTDPSYARQRTPGTLHNAGVGIANGTGTGTGTGGGTGGGTGTTTTTTTTNSGTTSTVFSLPFDVSWEPDLWGRVANAVREYRNAAQVSAADLENERLTEQADLAVYYFELRGQDALQSVYDQTINADKASLKLTQALVETGIDNQESIEQSVLALQNAEEAGLGIATNRAVYEHAIATLIGKPASEFSLPKRSLTAAAPAIPIGIPSQLLERRPDIAAAERTMAEANALIGVEKAAYYPNLSLTGGGGLESSSISKLFSLPALFWSVGSSASETIFDGGLRRSIVAQYTAQYNADAAAYRQTVLTAFQQVEDELATLRITSEQIAKQQQAIETAQRYLKIAQARYETGLDPYLNVLTAETTLLQDEQTAANLRVTQMTAAVTLIQALGGGWDNSQLPGERSITSDAARKQLSRTP